MRNKTIVAGAIVAGLTAFFGAPEEAQAQVVATDIPPAANRDENWGAVSNVAMIIGVSTVFFMPRVYYNDPEATVGWKARWHVSMLAPAATLTAITWFIDQPIVGAIESTRPGCTFAETSAALPDSNCESFGGPSTHAFATWSVTGSGLGIFLVDTLAYSDSRFHVGSFVGNVLVPLTASMFTTIARGVEPGNADGYESGGQLVAGALPGFFTGVLLGVGYSLFQEPSCPYGDAVICW